MSPQFRQGCASSESFSSPARFQQTQSLQHAFFEMATPTSPDHHASSQIVPGGLNTSASAQSPSINIGTRGSVLAKIQAHAVERSLKEAHPEQSYQVCPVVVQGDRDKITPLQQLSQGENAKSLWTGELESMLEAGDLDIIVHCLKGKFVAASTTSVFG